MINMLEDYLRGLGSKKAYLLFARQWFPFGLDTILYAMNEAGYCSKLCAATGESAKLIEQQILIDVTIDCAHYIELEKGVLAAGFMGLPPVTKGFSTANCMDFYIIKTASGLEKAVRVPGGESRDQAQINIANLLVGKTFDSFYQSMRRAVRS